MNNSVAAARDHLLTATSRLSLDLLRPVLYALPRGAGKIYSLLGGQRRSTCWDKYGMRSARGRDHGLTMRLSLGNRFERETFYLGSFKEWELQHLLKATLRPGDTFLDVGSNIGMVTLYAAALVGKQGNVLAFEPNPDARKRLEEHILLNRLANVRSFAVAIGETPGIATLSSGFVHTSTSTLRHRENVPKSFQVEVVTLDSFLEFLPARGRIFLKIDAEGYDFSVLKGAGKLLSRPQIMIFAEVNDKWLGELGQSAEEMFEYMRSFGFEAYHPRLETRLLQRSVRLDPLQLPGPHHWFNALFVRKDALASALPQPCLTR